VAAPASHRHGGAGGGLRARGAVPGRAPVAGHDLL